MTHPHAWEDFPPAEDQEPWMSASAQRTAPHPGNEQDDLPPEQRTPRPMKEDERV